jgi:hypothetical protein
MFGRYKPLRWKSFNVTLCIMPLTMFSYALILSLL